MRVLMTGATAGIGFEAAKVMLRAEGTELVAGARSPSKAPAALAAAATILRVDLQSLAKVRAFIQEARARGPYDALVLNAGLQCVSARTSADGFELTFAVNHLAHYLLARELLGSVKPGGRVVFTSSGTHDPEEHTPIPAPRHADAHRLAHPETDPERDADPGKAGRRAYSTSKLCNVMTARELARRISDARPDIAVMAFDPGFTPGTGLARDYPGPAGWIFKRIFPLIIRSGPRVSTPAISGRLLAELVMFDAYARARGDYFAVRGPRLENRPPSALARDDAAVAKLWDDSAGLVGLSAA